MTNVRELHAESPRDTPWRESPQTLPDAHGLGRRLIALPCRWQNHLYFREIEVAEQRGWDELGKGVVSERELGHGLRSDTPVTAETPHSGGYDSAEDRPWVLPQQRFDLLGGELQRLPQLVRQIVQVQGIF